MLLDSHLFNFSNTFAYLFCNFLKMTIKFTIDFIHLLHRNLDHYIIYGYDRLSTY
jgi:hypothetical protein